MEMATAEGVKMDSGLKMSREGLEAGLQLETPPAPRSHSGPHSLSLRREQGLPPRFPRDPRGRHPPPPNT